MMVAQMVDESVAMELRENLQQLELTSLEKRLELEVHTTTMQWCSMKEATHAQTLTIPSSVIPS